MKIFSKNTYFGALVDGFICLYFLCQMVNFMSSFVM
jgi:hypothetical protein